jgi:hypothetical protein
MFLGKIGAMAEACGKRTIEELLENISSILTWGKMYPRLERSLLENEKTQFLLDVIFEKIATTKDVITIDAPLTIGFGQRVGEPFHNEIQIWKKDSGNLRDYRLELYSSPSKDEPKRLKVARDCQLFNVEVRDFLSKVKNDKEILYAMKAILETTEAEFRNQRQNFGLFVHDLSYPTLNSLNPDTQNVYTTCLTDFIEKAIADIRDVIRETNDRVETKIRMEE